MKVSDERGYKIDGTEVLLVTVFGYCIAFQATIYSLHCFQKVCLAWG